MLPATRNKLIVTAILVAIGGLAAYFIYTLLHKPAPTAAPGYAPAPSIATETVTPPSVSVSAPATVKTTVSAISPDLQEMLDATAPTSAADQYNAVALMSQNNNIYTPPGVIGV